MPGSGDYAEVLIPNVVSGDEKGDRGRRGVYAKGSKSSEELTYQSLKWLALVTLFFTGVLAVLAAIFIIRYEGKVSEYETRIAELELDLETFFKVVEEESNYDLSGQKKKGDDGELEWVKIFPQADTGSEETKSRRKRQAVFPNVPVAFGPEVRRTDDGVPIVEQSYQLHSPSARYQVPPTPESEGLRLYEGLVETGGRNEPKSLDFSTNQGLPTLLPHHKVSAAWSEKEANPALRARNARIQLRSGDSGYDDRYGGPRFANEFTYTRSTDRERMARRYRARPTAGPTSSTKLASSGGAGGTFHRNSRVASADGAYSSYHYQSPNEFTRRAVRRRGGSLRDGKGEVIAQVVQDDDDHHRYPGQERRYQRKMGSLRREESPQYLSRRPETYYRRPTPVPTTNPAGYSEDHGPLNVTINRSLPFGTYYLNPWSSTERPYYQNYRSRY